MKGSLYVTNDPQLVLNSAKDYSIICISGETDEYQSLIQATNASIATILLPSYDAVMMELDGNVEGFIGSYFNYLSSKEPSMFINLILRAIYNGTNVLLYLTKEESRMNYINVFAKYFADVFGITIGSETTQYIFNPAYLPIIFDTLYLNDLMTTAEYIKYFPNTVIVNPMTATKAAMELSLYVSQDNDVLAAVNHYKSLFTGEAPVVPFRRC